ncbi:MAG: glycosyltransferase family 4 protein [Nitrososphaerales archaeon]
MINVRCGKDEANINDKLTSNHNRIIVHFHHTFFNLSETFIRRLIQFHKYFSPVALCFRTTNIKLKPANTLLFRIPRSPIDITRAIVPLYFPSYNILVSIFPSHYELYVKELFNECLDKHTELILSHFGNNAPYAVRLAKSLKIPLFVYFYGFDVTVILKKCPKYYKYLEKDVEAAFVTSKYLYSRLIECGFARPIYLCRLGLNLSEYKFNPERISLNKGNPVVIVSVGRLVEIKGHEYLIAAAEILVKKGYNVKVIIIGDGPRKNILYNLIKKLGLVDTVRLTGMLPHEKVTEYLHKSNVFVFPSVLCRDGSTETLGYACVEAMACGLPVVASNVGGIPEYVINNQTGLLVEQRSPRQIAEAIEELINNPKKAKKLAENARKLVEEMFDISKNVRELELTLMKYISN